MSEKLKISTNSHFLEKKTSHMTSYSFRPHPTIYLIRIFIINCKKKTQRFRSLFKNRLENQNFGKKTIL